MKELIDKVLEEKLNKYSPIGVPLGTNLRLAFEKAGETDMIVPVVGTQGMGKSTLINAILQENILPEGADETTCVPVEVRYCDKRCAEVYFKDGKDKAVVHSREELNEYVDNNYNHANKKQVAHIILYRDNELLMKGLIIVDLPGLNSLTTENGETTTRYMENIGSAIILISTIPTITRSESHFIKFLWKQFSSVIFVQNDWGETQQEIQESVEENTRVLSLIADELKVPFDNNIHVINVRSALDGALQNNPQLIKSSRISTLINNLKDLVQNWGEVKSKYLTNRIQQAILASIKEIKKRLEEQSLAYEEVVRQRQENLANHRETTRRLKEKVDSATILLRQKSDDVYRYARDNAKICADNIRNEMYAAIDGGIHDGENLENTFDKVQQKHISEYFNQVFNLFQIIQGEVKDKIEEIEDLFQESEVNIQSEKANRPRQFKWEQNLEAACGIGGIFAGQAIAGKIAAIAAANGWNPAGWVLGAIAIAVSIGSLIAGIFAKKRIKRERARKAKEALKDPLYQLEKQLKDYTMQEFEKFQSKVVTALETLIKQRADEESSLNSSIYDKSEVDTKDLNEDLTYFEQKEKEFSHV